MDYPQPPTPPEKRIIREDFSFKFLCKIGLHRYEDHIKVGKLDLKTNGLPVEATEICRRCKKTRRHVEFTILDKEVSKCQKIS